MAGRDLVFNLISNTSNFAAGMKSAKKAADDVFMSTRTNLEKFQIELSNLQSLKDKGLLDAESTKRAQGMLVEKYDPFGFIAQKKAEEKAAAEKLQLIQQADQQEKANAQSKAEWQARIIENAKRMEYAHLQSFNAATKEQSEKRLADAKARTQQILDSERAAASKRVQVNADAEAKIAVIRERHAERVGRALLAEVRAEARGAELARGVSGSGGNRLFMFQQLAFAAEDAATQFGTRGMSGALMAAGNNLSFAASMANPLVGTLVSLGLAGATTALVLGKIKGEAKGAGDEVKKLKEEADSLRSIHRDRREFAESLSMGTVSQNRDRLKDIRGLISDEEHLRNTANQRVFKAQLEMIAAENKAWEAARRERTVEFMSGHGVQRVTVRPSEEEARLEVQHNRDLAEARQRYKTVLAEEQRIKENLRTLRMREGQAEAGVNLARGREKILEKERAGSEAVEAFQRKQEERQIRANRLMEEAKTMEERRADRLREINELEEHGKLTKEQSLKLTEKARLEAEAEKRANEKPLGNLLTGALDIRSSEAYSVLANAYAQSSMRGGAGLKFSGNQIGPAFAAESAVRAAFRAGGMGAGGIAPNNPQLAEIMKQQAAAVAVQKEQLKQMQKGPALNVRVVGMN